MKQRCRNKSKRFFVEYVTFTKTEISFVFSINAHPLLLLLLILLFSFQTHPLFYATRRALTGTCPNSSVLHALFTPPAVEASKFSSPGSFLYWWLQMFLFWWTHSEALRCLSPLQESNSTCLCSAVSQMYSHWGYTVHAVFRREPVQAVSQVQNEQVCEITASTEVCVVWVCALNRAALLYFQLIWQSNNRWQEHVATVISSGITVLQPLYGLNSCCPYLDKEATVYSLNDLFTSNATTFFIDLSKLAYLLLMFKHTFRLSRAVFLSNLTLHTVSLLCFIFFIGAMQISHVGP